MAHRLEELLTEAEAYAEDRDADAIVRACLHDRLANEPPF